MNKQYFTIRTSNTAGFGDQLGTQFSRLYSFGHKLGLEYRYSPITFPRSVEPEWHNIFKKFIFYIRYYILFSKVVNPKVHIVSKILERVESYMNRLNSMTKDQTLSQFIGLTDHKNQIRNAKYYDVYIDQLIDKDLFTIPQIRKELHLCDEKKNDESTIIRLCWGSNTYNYISQIDSLCDISSNSSEAKSHSFLSEQYWTKRQSEGRPDMSSNALVVHVRCGDSTVIDLGARKFTLNGPRIINDEEMKKILAIDDNRAPIEFEDYKRIFDLLSSNFKPDAFQVVIISDGYRQSYYNFLRFLLQFSNSIRLTNQEKRILKIKIKTFNSDFKYFDYFKNTKFIIGETKKNLFASIDSLADAKTVIWGSGGFAYYTHSLLRKQSSLIIHVKNFNDDTLAVLKQKQL